MFRTLFCSSLLVLAAACGNSSSSSGANAGNTTAEISVALTDAATDELTMFEVDVRNVVFTKVNGDTFEVMPSTVRVDFLELESLAELVAARVLEPGGYRRITLDLDFTDAQVVIAGQTTPATVKDRAGNTITGVVPVVIDFPDGKRPQVHPNRNNLWVLDLHLDQSVVVDAPTNSVTFTPVVTVAFDPSNPKPLSVSGTLLSVDTTARTFVLQRLAPDGTVVNDITVATGDGTVFQLDGVVVVGNPGLGSLPIYIGSRVFAQGTVATSDRMLRATTVEAGAGVPGNGQDWVYGHVVERTGGAGADATLTIIGRSFDVATDTRLFNTTYTVNTTLGNTKVLRRGAGNSLNTDAINIGQLVWVFGDLSATTLDATATTGVVRLLPTSIFGLANGAPASDTLFLDVVRFGLRPIADFDFDIGGSIQANPDNYTVDLDGLSSAGITTGTKLRVLAWINGVGASGADAIALSVQNRSAAERVLFCQWSPPASSVLSGAQSASFALDVSAADVRVVDDGFGSVELQTSPTPRIDGLGSSGLYLIVDDDNIEVETTFSTFRNTVLQRTATAPVFRVSGTGTFDESTQTFRASTLTVVLD